MSKDLFDEKAEENKKKNAPLAEKMRPEDFNEFFGQDDIVGEDSPLRQAIEDDDVRSLIFWGPPGSGKTTLARIIAKKTGAVFEHFSAVTTGIGDVRDAIEEAANRLKFNNKKTILFIDEIHRFNKAQQDALLPHVEDGTVILIGATTENPSFEVVSPLLSRSVVYSLDSLSDSDLEEILKKALSNKKKGLGKYNLDITDEALEKLIVFADGDARAGLNSLEFIARTIFREEKEKIEEEDVSRILQKHALRYDKKGEEHHNIVSAYIKSMRDSKASAALYWLGRMLESGQDPKFIARRMIIFASEDIGIVDNHALTVANDVARAVEFVGLPEAQINLAHGTTYLANAPKSNDSYEAIKKAREDAKEGSYGVPLHLRNAHTKFNKNQGYGKDYKYAHDDEEGAQKQDHFPEEIGEKDYFEKEN